MRSRLILRKEQCEWSSRDGTGYKVLTMIQTYPDVFDPVTRRPVLIVERCEINTSTSSKRRLIAQYTAGRIPDDKTLASCNVINCVGVSFLYGVYIPGE